MYGMMCKNKHQTTIGIRVSITRKATNKISKGWATIIFRTKWLACIVGTLLFPEHPKPKSQQEENESEKKQVSQQVSAGPKHISGISQGWIGDQIAQPGKGLKAGGKRRQKKVEGK